MSGPFLVSKLVRPLWVLLVTQIFLMTLAASVGTAADGQGEWEKTVRAAKAEGQLTIYANVGYEKIFQQFEKRYPEIRVVYVTGRGGPDLVPRGLRNEKASSFTAEELPLP